MRCCTSHHDKMAFVIGVLSTFSRSSTPHEDRRCSFRPNSHTFIVVSFNAKLHLSLFGQRAPDFTFFIAELPLRHDDLSHAGCGLDVAILGVYSHCEYLPPTCTFSMAIDNYITNLRTGYPNTGVCSHVVVRRSLLISNLFAFFCLCNSRFGR